MLTEFSPRQLSDPVIAEADGILRSCVHCGFCTATCPTFHLLGDELDSPRGRIVLIKEMHENGGVPGSTVVKHLDRCLTCLSCMTTCPSGVNYMHLVDHARVVIEKHKVRPLLERIFRAGLLRILQSRGLFRKAQAECGVHVRDTFDTAFAVVLVHDRLDDGKTEAGAARRVVARRVDAIEAVEDSFQMRLGDAGADVGYG